MSQIVLATTNPGKANEFKSILGENFEVFVPAELPFVPEDGETLAENAYKKARGASDFLGHAALADDSGLFVTALDGKPGVHSARFAGSDSDDAANRLKLIEMIRGISDRRAYFATVLCLCAPGTPFDEAIFFEGRCDGDLLDHELGSNGFGYDSIFVPLDGDGRTFGEMTANEKAELSHRSKAISKLRVSLLEKPF